MKIILKKNEHRRIIAGHLWVFSNEVESVEDFSVNGCIADLYSHDNVFLGRGVYNKNSLIAFRLLSYNRVEINKEFFIRVFQDAEEKRKKFFGDKYYRLINGESDFVPGLIIDRFDNRFSVRIFCLGLEKMKNIILDAVIELFSPSCVIEKNNFEHRKLEGLDLTEGIIYGRKDYELIAEIDNVKYHINILKGQKTGFYYDQRINRLKIRNYVKRGDDVLDVFCNDGGFGLNALYKGAGNVTFIDSSGYALSNTEYNCKINFFTDFKIVKGDAFNILNRYAEEKRKYDLIVLDPPSFTKSKKNIKTAEKGYTEINSNAMKLLKNNSLLMTYSCSHHISSDIFVKILVKSAFLAGRKIQIIGNSEISPDHPILPQMAETEYLKGFVVLVD